MAPQQVNLVLTTTPKALTPLDGIYGSQSSAASDLGALKLHPDLPPHLGAKLVHNSPEKAKPRMCASEPDWIGAWRPGRGKAGSARQLPLAWMLPCKLSCPNPPMKLQVPTCKLAKVSEVP